MVIFGPTIWMSKEFALILQACIATPLDFKYQLEVKSRPSRADESCSVCIKWYAVTCENIWRVSCQSLHTYLCNCGKISKTLDTLQKKLKQALISINLKLHLNVCFRQSLMVLRGGSLFVRMRFLEGWNYLSILNHPRSQKNINRDLKGNAFMWMVFA